MLPEVIPIEILMRAFPGIRNIEANEILSSSEVCTFKSDSIICHEGTLETTFYIILEGDVRVTKRINPVEVRILNQLHAGDFFGEMAIIHNAPRAATITAITPTTTLVIQEDAFSKLLEHSTSVSLAMVREVSRRLRENDEMAIEDLRNKAKELADAYQQLAEKDYARQEFLTSIAHNLRTPLMAANGFLQLIQTGKLQGDGLANAMDTIYRNMQDIVALTNDILFLQEMELILPEFHTVDVEKAITRSVEDLHSFAERNQVNVRLSVKPGIPTMQADSNSLERAVAAIIHNAIKFSPQGGDVLVSLGFDSDHIIISIEDHGVGISPEVLPKIFDRFYHMDKIGGHLFKGIGLGLSIARQVIKQHNGEIRVESQPGKGSIFTLLLNIQF